METSFTDVRVSRVRSPCIVVIILIQVCNLKFEELLIYGAHKGKDSTGDVLDTTNRYAPNHMEKFCSTLLSCVIRKIS